MSKYFKSTVLCIIFLLSGFWSNIYTKVEEFTNNINIELEKKLDTEIEQIEVDGIFSIGDNCRPAHYLREHKLRTKAAPLDWMMKYSLDTVLHLFETKFTDFFVNIKEIPTEDEPLDPIHPARPVFVAP